MRLLYFAAALPLAILSTPSDESVRMALQPAAVTTTRLDAPVDAHRMPLQIGAGTLVYAVAPAKRDGPVMPGIPVPLYAVAPDVPPAAIVPPPALAAMRADHALAQASVTATSLNIRSGPSSLHPVVAGLVRGDRPFLTGQRESDWVQVRLHDTGAQGWVHGAYLAF